jgi:glucan phosphoethanolaminetransferase (alkaline phosphatase superfamily)
MTGRKIARVHGVALVAIALLVSLLMTPNVLWAATAFSTKSFVEALLLPSLLLLLVFALAGKRIWIACAVLAPFAAAAPAEIFYVVTYGHPSTDQIIATIFATNPRETLEYFGDGLAALLLCSAIAIAIAATAAWYSFRSHLAWKNQIRSWVVAIMLCVPLIFAAETGWSTVGDIGTRLRSGWSAVSELSGIVENGYPFGPIVRFMDYRETWTAMANSVAARDTFRFHVSPASAHTDHATIVLVIGESSRRDRWQMFGYEKPTNQELSQIPNLILITDMVNSWSASIRAIPQLLTRKPITDNTAAWGEPSIVRAMQEGGFETWWISNQMPIGKYDSPVSMYALEAQHRMFLNRATYAAAGSYDELLVQPLADLLEKNTDRNLFIVLHMMGSHLRYDGRYPPQYKRFIPTISDAGTDVPDRDRTNNSFDNTIVYTDHVLAKIVQALQKSSGPSALLFESDHGETLPTLQCSISGHGVGDRFDFEVPAFFWFSESYGRSHRELIEHLRANAGKRTLSADTFESIIDMGDLTYPGRNETQSLFSSRWQLRTRVVEGGEPVDFDNARPGAGCGVLFAKGPEKSGSSQ